MDNIVKFLYLFESALMFTIWASGFPIMDTVEVGGWQWLVVIAVQTMALGISACYFKEFWKDK